MKTKRSIYTNRLYVHYKMLRIQKEALSKQKNMVSGIGLVGSVWLRIGITLNKGLLQNADICFEVKFDS